MELYRCLVESSPDGILVVAGGRIAYVNPAAIRLFGVNGPDYLLGTSLIDRFDADSRAAVDELLSHQRTGGTTLPIDAKIARPGGWACDVSLTMASVEHDGHAAVQVIVRDIAERKAAERALRESEERLALAVAGGQEGVWDWNLETNAVVYSSRWKQMLGYSDEEIEPHVGAWERLVHPDDRPRADRAHDSVARGERATYEAEFRLRHNGSTRRETHTRTVH